MTFIHSVSEALLRKAFPYARVSTGQQPSGDDYEVRIRLSTRDLANWRYDRDRGMRELSRRIAPRSHKAKHWSLFVR